MNHKQVIYQTKTSKLFKRGLILHQDNRQWWFRSIVFVTLFLLLASCTQQPRISTKETLKSIFTDTDIDRAEIVVAKQVGKLEGQNMGQTPLGTILPVLPDHTSDFSPQVVLPNTDGFVYYIQHNPTAVNPWQVIRHDQSTDTQIAVISTQREIQSVAGSLDGNIVMVAMRQTTTTPNDFEIFRLNISSAVTQRLTTDTVDNIHVGVSADGLKVIWQHLVGGSLETVFLRTYATTTTTSSFTEVALSSASSQVEPSISGNGRFIVLVRLAALKTIQRFDTRTSSYLELASTGRFQSFQHPSVSDDGNKITWLFRSEVGALSAQLKNIEANTLQDVLIGVDGDFEHPFMTSDGNFLSYSLKQNNTFKVHVKNLATGAVRRIFNPTAPVTHIGSMWQKIPLFGHETKLVAPTSAPADEMGSSVAVDGNTLVACASREDSRGACHVFTQSAGVWTFVKKLQATDAADFDFFGSSVAISGSFIVVGVPSEDHNADGVAGDENAVGAAYVFSRNKGGTNNWGQVKKLIASDDAGFDVFGHSVAIDGDFIVVGAPDNDISSNTNQGSAYIFFRNQGGTNQWGEIKQLSHSDVGANDDFGTSVSIDNNTIAVGARGNDAAYIFEKDTPNTDGWGQVKKLSGFSTFGSSVALELDTLAVGADQESGSGTVSVFGRNQGGAGAWGLVKKVSSSHPTGGDFFGNEISLKGDTLVVGASLEDVDLDQNGLIDCSGFSGTECRAGAVYIFQRNIAGSNAWGELRRLSASDVGLEDSFGTDVAAGNGFVLVGLPGPSNGDSSSQHPGAVYIYK
jgi:FG-GAP repeat